MRTNHWLAMSLGLLSFACASTGASSGARTKHTDSRWLQPSPALRQQLDDQISRLPWTHGVERIEQIRWFATIGEPAYDDLLELCLDPRTDVASSAVAALGATGDARLVDSLHEIEWADTPSAELKFERARALVRLGDWSALGVLVDGLEDPTQWARAWCAQVLREVTGSDLGFDAAAAPEVRATSVARWRDWISSRAGEGILAAGRA